METVKLLKELISINSVFPDERELAEYVELHLIELGFSITRIPITEGRFNVVAERGAKGSPILFYGHLDTVPPYGHWKKKPTEPWEEDDRLYGLGASDMKAGIAAILKACEVETERKIGVAFGVDEENISEGAFAIMKSGFLKGYEGAIVTEAGESDKGSFGSRMITLGRRGHVVFEVNVPGKSAHGAHLKLGINAINEAARFVIALDSMPLPYNNLFPPASHFICRIASENSSLSIPDSAILEVDRHTVPPETSESALLMLQDFIDELYLKGMFAEINGNRITAKIKERKTYYLEAYATQKENAFVKRTASAVREYHKSEPIWNYAASVADENVFASGGLPVVTIGTIGGNEHSANEWVSKQSYLDLIEVLKRVLSE